METPVNQPGIEGYDGRALAEEFRALVREIGFGSGRPPTLVAHDTGAPPAILWAADHREEVAGLIYLEVPVMLSEVLTKIIAYTPEAMKGGSMWRWSLPLAPDVPERLIVGNERAFLTWFYERHARPGAIDKETVDEYLRTFAGRQGVLGAFGVYRAAFATIEKTIAVISFPRSVRMRWFVTSSPCWVFRLRRRRESSALVPQAIQCRDSCS